MDAIQRHLSSRATIFGLVALALLIKTSMVVLGYQHVKQLEQDWKEFANFEWQVGQTLRTVSDAFGYGGYIHQFKNIVLRAEQERFAYLNDSGQMLQSGLQTLNSTWRNPRVKQAIAEIQTVFNQYRQKEQYLYSRSHLSPSELDALVQVDDTPALAAFSKLRMLFQEELFERRETLNSDIETAVILLFFWLCGFLLYIFLGWICYHFIRRHESDSIQMQALAARLNVIINHSPNALLVANNNGKILTASEKTFDVFKTSRDQFIGTQVEQWIPERFRSGHQQKRKLFMENQGTRGMDDREDLLALDGKGNEIPVKITISSVQHESESFVVACVQELLQLKKEEQQKMQHQRLEAVGRLTAGVAHDFNNMLAIIVGNAEVAELCADEKDMDLNESLAIIKQAANNAAELTSKLLVFSREQPLHSSRVDITQALHELQSLLNRVMGEDIGINVTIAEGLWPCFLDKVHLESALMNIAINAKNAMPRGGHFDISAANCVITAEQKLDNVGLQLNAGEYVVITLMDTGTGIPDAVLSKIYDPFFTLDNNKGSGLGLSLVYGFIKQSGGFIEVDSEENRGTRFTLFLPHYCEPDTAPTALKHTLAKFEELKDKRILVIEDEEPVRVIATKLFKLAGCLVFAAEDRQEALAIANQESLDVIFSDVVLQQGDNGFAICAEIKKLQPEVKLVFASGYFSEDLKARQYLVDDVKILKKPYTREQVYQAICESYKSK